MWLLLALSCVKKPVPPPPPPAPAPVSRMAGTASWYGAAFAGKPTASGVPFQPSKLTAAHRSLPFGTKVEVTRTDTGAKVVVVINDRGPYSGGRVIDVSEAAAKQLGMITSGVAPVQLRIVGCDPSYSGCR